MITIIDYKAGNLTSVQLAFDCLGVQTEITDNPDKILSAQKIVFPGVGAAAAAMANLTELKLIEPIKQIISDGKPFFGICIGMQLLFDFSQEDGGTNCLAIIPGSVKKFEPKNKADKIPQMGWNTVNIVKPHPLWENIDDNSEFYFVHSFYPNPNEQKFSFGQTEYADIVFASAAGFDNVFATQFHPERSGRIGLRLFENFCRWDGKC